MPRYDVVIVGAGAAGVGVGVVLRYLGIERFVLLERHEIGASFLRWPKEMRFISPSFPSNAFGLLDLNAIAPDTSPAYSLRCEHPGGAEYAHYLRSVAIHYELPVHTGVDVQWIEPCGDDGFRLHTTSDRIESRFVVWAAGEFQYPNVRPFPGAEYCLHTSTIDSWRDVAGQERIIIGGYESGIDAAIHLSNLHTPTYVLDRLGIWDYHSSDPSRVLSPYTQQRLVEALSAQRIRLVGGVSIVRVERRAHTFAVIADDGRVWESRFPPVLATGFDSSLSLVRDLFAWHADDGYVLLTDEDESTRTPGLFLAGPQVRHGDIIFCFIYKFRQRFAVVAQAIGARLGIDLASLDIYRRAGMFLDDLSCCTVECTCGA
ncbi:NAD(P)/FAD-dependent oxidoreductase [Roseiflexus sp.]|uniref:NAD(P)/FAD-dependent oxidoreductase n=1 Tax=Roseiflexus sp. TaxID=2562120 RepID=UPI00398AAC46